MFARYCGVVTEHLGDGIAWAVTLNEPNLPRLLSWLDIPGAVRELERATLLAASEQADVRFGLHEVDRETFARRPKPSAAVYAAIARANAVGGP